MIARSEIESIRQGWMWHMAPCYFRIETRSKLSILVYIAICILLHWRDRKDYLRNATSCRSHAIEKRSGIIEKGKRRRGRGEVRWHERVSYPDVSSMHTYTHASVSVYDIHVHIYTYHAAYCNEAEELRIFDSRGYYLYFEINICPYFSSSIYLFGLYHRFVVFIFFSFFLSLVFVVFFFFFIVIIMNRHRAIV